MNEIDELFCLFNVELVFLKGKGGSCEFCFVFDGGCGIIFYVKSWNKIEYIVIIY